MDKLSYNYCYTLFFISDLTLAVNFRTKCGLAFSSSRTGVGNFNSFVNLILLTWNFNDDKIGFDHIDILYLLIFGINCNVALSLYQILSCIEVPLVFDDCLVKI